MFVYPCKITNRNTLVISPGLSIIECDECDKVLKDHFSKEIVKEKNIISFRRNVENVMYYHCV